MHTRNDKEVMPRRDLTTSPVRDYANISSVARYRFSWMPKSLEFAIASASVLMPLIMRYAIARSFRLRRARVLGQRRCELFTAYRI